MQLNCSYLTIDYSINYYVAVAALLQFSVDKLIDFYASNSSCRRVVNSKTCSRLLTATYNINWTCQIDALTRE